jgi:hypothetical protein
MVLAPFRDLQFIMHLDCQALSLRGNPPFRDILLTSSEQPRNMDTRSGLFRRPLFFFAGDQTAKVRVKSPFCGTADLRLVQLRVSRCDDRTRAWEAPLCPLPELQPFLARKAHAWGLSFLASRVRPLRCTDYPTPLHEIHSPTTLILSPLPFLSRARPRMDIKKQNQPPASHVQSSSN